ncbi:MAG: DNA cytosine methyltransferase [Streptococcaceae bacterium]|jgi:DNA (cytosine-5)-methyltransferase 1|nr:DNA cytosine methyltransferase [Streptococcaceae bacterium]
MNKSKKIIDLFSGAGGLSLGFEQAGFQNLFSVEFNHEAAETYRKNFPHHKLIEGDIRDISNQEIQKLKGNSEVDVIIGGPPCQGFSMAGNIGRKFIDDERNKLFKEFVRFVDVIQPKMFVMENVARLNTHNKGQTIQEIVSEFEKLGYEVEKEVLQAAEHGVPQKRQRIFIVGRKNGEFKFPDIEEKVETVEEAIGNLPVLESGESSSIPNHFAMNHSEQMLEKMSYVHDGGDRNDIPEPLRPKSGDIRKYIRYASDKPSVTVTGDMRKVFHYAQNRALTPRELARLQTFPDDFIFEGNSISIQQQIGNAVPPKLAKSVAEEVRKCLETQERRDVRIQIPQISKSKLHRQQREVVAVDY